MIRRIESFLVTGAVALGRTKVFCVPVLIAALGWALADRATGQTLTIIYSFNGDDGSDPQGGLIISGNTLYGTTLQGGVANGGVVFALSTDGTDFTNLYSFPDFALPTAGLIFLGDAVAGTTGDGGNSGFGTVFSVNTDGTGFTNLYNFTAPTGPLPFPTNSDGANPAGGLTLSGNALYGTAGGGGIGGNGTVFSISLPVVPALLTVTPLAQSVILKWPSNATGYTLQSTTNFGSSAVWTTNLPAPVVVNGQNTVTNPITGTQQFFRLSQ
jgi:uncharacterized repeat protein (TIGR03803 family)